MKKVALVFVLAVLLPSLVLAWLAVRSLRDQQFLLERQQSLLYQRVTDALAADIAGRLAQQQQEFSAQVEGLLAGRDARTVASEFDSELRRRWPLAEVGFCVTVSGKILSPAPNAQSEARTFYTDNGGFLGNREAVEVYRSVNNNAQNTGPLAMGQSSSFNGAFGGSAGQKQLPPTPAFDNPAAKALPADKIQADRPALVTASMAPLEEPKVATANGKQTGSRTSLADVNSMSAESQGQNNYNNYKAQSRKVSPQSGNYEMLKDSSGGMQNNLSRVVPAEAEFSQLIGNETDGMLARFLQNKLKLMFWH
jgi:hypothetical protein